MKHFIELLLNGMEPVMFLVFLVYAYMGFAFNLGIDILSRDPKSPTSPVRFSASYWWQDNKKRVIISIVLMPILVIVGKLLTGMDMNILNAFLLGWSGDALSNLLKKKSDTVASIFKRTKTTQDES